MLSKCSASTEQILSKCWANALKEGNGSKCWANAQQVLSKYSSSAEQILSKCWANAQQVLSKYSSSAEQILRQYWANTQQVQESLYTMFHAKFGGCRSKMVDIWVLWTCFYFFPYWYFLLLPIDFSQKYKSLSSSELPFYVDLNFG